MLIVTAFLYPFLASLLLAVVIVATKRIHGHLTLDGHVGIQKLHRTPTPRVGGVAILGGLAVGSFVMPPSAADVWFLVLLAGLPAFLFGLMEDVTKRVGVRTRLVATIVSGLVFSLLTGYHLSRVDLPVLDHILAFWVPAVLFTAFAIGGIANAINIIDGVNGLASGTSIIILSGFAVLAWQAGDQEMLVISITLAGALSGFFVLNFPMGRIFLGDAGAYATGFALAAIAVALPQRNPELSPLVGLLALSYPVTETMVSIRRRIARKGSHPGQPDRLHLHSLIYRSRARRLAEAIGAPQLRNAIAGLMVMGLPLLSCSLMIGTGYSTPATAAAVLFVALVYLVIYRRVALLGRHSPVAT